MVDNGLAPMDALVVATRNGARLLGLDHEVGTIEAGKCADLIAFPGDLLDRIAALCQPCFVMKGGEFYRVKPPARLETH